jgi:hypothetical protein
MDMWPANRVAAVEGGSAGCGRPSEYQNEIAPLFVVISSERALSHSIQARKA